jgi:hypothetical protein
MRGLLGLAFLVLPAVAYGEMYKCVDRNGVTHYADSPLPGCKGKEVDIRPIPSLSGGEIRRRDEDFAQQDAEFKRRQNERAEAEAQERAALEARCRSLRREHGVLASGRRLSRTNERGELVYMPDQARQEQLARVQQALRACP